MRGLILAAVGCLGFLMGCNGSYTTPGEKADFSKLGLTAEQAAGMTDA